MKTRTDTQRSISPHPPLLLPVLLLPFLMFHWMIPFVSRHTLGNDYIAFPIQDQMYLMFSLRAGSFPLFIPGFYIGHSSAALTLGQIFHPLSHIAASLPGYWQGYALEWNTLLRLFSLGLAHWAVFVFLVRLHLRPMLAFLISFVTTYNLRMLDLFRYGASLEAYTAHLMLICALGSFFLNHGRGRGQQLLIILLTYMLVVSGHPQMMYFALLGTILFTMIIPFFVPVMLPEHTSKLKDIFVFWGKAGTLIAAGVLLASAYTLPFYFDFIRENATRVGQEYSWADAHIDTWAAAWGNFFSPLLACGTGAFGGASLLGLAAVLPVARLCKVRVPPAIWTVWGLLMIIFLLTLGGKTPLYPLFWEYFPLANNFRFPGRISLMIPVLSMLLLAWAARPQQDPGPPPLKILAFAAFLITVLFNGLVYPKLLSDPGSVSQLSLVAFGLKDPFLKHSDILLVFLVIAWMGAILLFLLSMHDLSSSSSSKFLLAICILTVLQVSMVLRHGTYYRDKRIPVTLGELTELNRVRLSYSYYPGYGMAMAQVASHIEKFFHEPFLARIFKDIVPMTSRERTYTAMERYWTPQTAYVEDPAETISLKKNAQEPGGTVTLDHSSMNRLIFSVSAPSPAFIGLAYPHTFRWNVLINGKKTKTYRINGLYVGAELPQGRNTVEFRYFSPAAFWGMVVSCAALWMIGVCFCWPIFAGGLRAVGLVSVTALSVGLFLSWHASLYTGDNIGTTYKWSYIPSSQEENLAYGRTVILSGSFYEFPPLAMVDGDRRPNSGSISKFNTGPTATLDLHQVALFHKIVLFEAGNKPAGAKDISLLGSFIDKRSKFVNVRPMTIELSADGIDWRTVATVTENKVPGQPIRLEWAKPVQARYIRIHSGLGVIGFDELEVY